PATVLFGAPRPPCRAGPLHPVAAADHVEHHLVGAGADPVEADVAVGALDLVLLHVAVATEDLDRVVGDFAGDPRGVELRHRDLAHRVLAVGEAPGGRVGELPGGLGLGRHLGDLVTERLELADRAAERFTLLRVLDRLLDHPLRPRVAAGGGDQALALELPGDVVEAFALLAEYRTGRDTDVFEGQFAGVGGVHPHLLQLGRDAEPGYVLALLVLQVDDEEGDAGVALLRVGLRDQDDEVGARPVGDEGLRAVDDEFVTVPDRGRADAGDVGPRAR